MRLFRFLEACQASYLAIIYKSAYERSSTQNLHLYKRRFAMETNLAIHREEMLSLFSECSDNFWNSIQTSLQKKSFGGGQTLFSPEEKMSGNYSIFSLIEGSIALEVPPLSLNKDQSLTISLRKPGTLFGWPDERSVCTARVQSQTAKAILIPHSLFQKTLLEEPAVSRAIIRMQSERCRPYLKKLQLLMEESTERVKLVLQHIWEGIQQREIPKPHPSRLPRLRHLQIAEETGLTRETVSRTLEGDNPEIRELIDNLSPFLVIVARSGKLPENQYHKRVFAKEDELRTIAENIVNELFNRLGIEKNTRRHNQSVKIVLSQLMLGLKPGLALTAPEKDLIADRFPKLLKD